MRCPKCSGQMEINRIRTHLVWVDELDRIPDSKKPAGANNRLCMHGMRIHRILQRYDIRELRHVCAVLPSGYETHTGRRAG